MQLGKTPLDYARGENKEVLQAELDRYERATARLRNAASASSSIDH
jgi:hypothetical protein